MKEPVLGKLENERLNLAREVETLKALVYPTYKLYETYYTSDIFGKIGVFWQEMQYKIFTMFLLVGLLVVIGYLASMYLGTLLVILLSYVFIGGIAYVVKDRKKLQRLRKGPVPVKQKDVSTQEPNNLQLNAEILVPSREFIIFSDKVLSLSYPSNFNPVQPAPKGEVSFTLILQGYRNDSNVLIDVRPAKKLTLEKVIEQNTKFYKPTSTGETTIDGNKSMYLSYSMTKDVASRAYFVVKNDKIYRVIINYYKPSEKDFLPAFEKTISSIQIK